MNYDQTKKQGQKWQNNLSPHQIQRHEYRRLNLEEAHVLLPMVRKLTQQSARTLAPLQKQLNNMVPADPRMANITKSYEDTVRNWSGKIERLGLNVLGLWCVGFDCGEGWYAWQFPERRIRYFVEYGQFFKEALLIESLELSESFVSVKNK